MNTSIVNAMGVTAADSTRLGGLAADSYQLVTQTALQETGVGTSLVKAGTRMMLRGLLGSTGVTVDGETDPAAVRIRCALSDDSAATGKPSLVRPPGHRRRCPGAVKPPPICV